MDDKEALRTQYRATRDAMDASAHDSLSARACERLVRRVSPDWRRVAIYASTGSELRTEGLFSSLRQRGVHVLLPRCDRDQHRLDFAPARSLDDTRPGAYGIAEPTTDAVDLAGIDAFVLPALAFDRHGQRLGSGGGYYDRTLGGVAGVRIGLAYATQVTGHLPSLEHDLRMDCVVTDAEVIELGSNDRSSEPGRRTVR